MNAEYDQMLIMELRKIMIMVAPLASSPTGVENRQHDHRRRPLRRYRRTLIMSAMRTRKRLWARWRTEWTERMIVEGGVPCWRCGQLIHADEPWDLGHKVARALGGTDEHGLSPEHRLCSRRAGAQLKEQLRTGTVGLVHRAPGQLFADEPAFAPAWPPRPDPVALAPAAPEPQSAPEPPMIW